MLDDNIHYKMFRVDSRLRYFKPHANRIERTFAEAMSNSLGRKAHSRFISPKFFYDDVGSKLFENICHTPEYYLTRTEIGILKDVCDVLGTMLGDDMCGAGGSQDRTGKIKLVDLGSGSSTKTRIMLDMLIGVQRHLEYCPIDISDILAQSSEQLLADYPDLSITGIIDTYEGGLEFLKEYGAGRSLIMFLGSSYGNLSPVEGLTFLRNVRSTMKRGDLFLIGLDRVKDTRMLESAYNDAAGITSKFNLNVLTRMNAELGADFKIENFEHRARYNPDKQRMEMHLESLCEQVVTIPKSDLVIRLEKGEFIHTENSYKFVPAQIQDRLASAGLTHVRSWTDKNEYFTVVLATVC